VNAPATYQYLRGHHARWPKDSRLRYTKQSLFDSFIKLLAEKVNFQSQPDTPPIGRHLLSNRIVTKLDNGIIRFYDTPTFGITDWCPGVAAVKARWPSNLAHVPSTHRSIFKPPAINGHLPVVALVF
jgi:hypothetical protein